ncbi:glutamine ABC transporter substrate-binding protein GlnH [Leucobacter sp. Psy1]|uniref:transporter substrate-binding domain-containing protein n=1 Tax=Leucobacter sp. Psy1 TaxID=2875729 RepID=UPI001CD707CE|nr:transporter substrate-binding domain-containing protein [Leucobacter sp. Psy1]UBH06814.1 glutamine ABC transporter substrate-binding protein GlnH [Leucobacter sp. Psy1]
MISRTRRSTTVAALATVTLAAGLVGCAGGDGGGSESGEADPSNLEDSYTVATDSSFVPFEFEEDGEHVGFDMDIINAIADEVGFDVNLEVTNFDGIIPGLQTGSFDIAIAGITITDERKNAVDFLNPYYKSGTRIAVPESNDSVESIEDLAGLTVASRLGSAPLDYLAENVPDAEALPFEQLDQMYLAVEGGSADALLYDAPNVEYYIDTTDTDLKVVGDLYEAQFYGVAVSQGNEDLVTAMNDALDTLIENGTYAEIYEEWFGEQPTWLDEIGSSSDEASEE